MRPTLLVVVALLAAAAACAHATRASPPTAPAPAAAPTEWISDPDEYQDHGISAAAGERYFGELGGGDPYATGLAYPFLLALLEAYPDELGRNVTAFADRFGFLRDPAGSADALPIGMHLTKDPITRVSFVMMNCRLCHAARLRLPDGDHIVSGLGNPRVRIHAYDAALMRIAGQPTFTPERMLPLAARAAREHGLAFPAEMQEPVVRETIRKMKERAALRATDAKRLASGLPGRVATIESFAMALNVGGAHVTMPQTIGWAKIPDVRGFSYRDSLSWDGVGTGSPVALAAEADFAFGARAEWYESHRHIATSLYLFLKHFDRHLPYPGTLDAAVAKQGESVFNGACAKCHGYYALDSPHGRLRYHEHVVPIAMLGTDRARLDAVTPEFVAAANRVPLARGVTTIAATAGYVPPVLLDVWARGPYGHVGQWPSVEVMAMKPEDRPRHFVVDTDAPYDVAHLGQAWGATTTGPASRAGQYAYDGDTPGYAVTGHRFLCDLPPDDRRAVIEYLKTL